MSTAQSYDPPSLTAARVDISNQVNSWLNPAESADVTSNDDDAFVTKSVAIGLIVLVCVLAATLIVGGIGDYFVLKQSRYQASISLP